MTWRSGGADVAGVRSTDALAWKRESYLVHICGARAAFKSAGRHLCSNPDVSEAWNILRPDPLFALKPAPR